MSWAGEEQSANWFDTAREFTERWHHQQQIRLAVGQPGIMSREFYYPVLVGAETTIPQEIAWRIFTKGIDRQSALAQVKVTGDSKFGLHVLQMVSIVA